MKKKLIFSNYDDIDNPYYGGGGAIAIHETAKRMVDTYQVTVVTGSYPGAKNQIRDGIPYERIGMSWGGPKVGQLIYMLCLPALVMTKSFDIWLEGFTPPFSTGLLPLFTKKPVVGIIHMLSGEDMKRKYYLPFDRIEGLGLKAYTYLICTSETIRSQVKKANKSASVVVVPLGIRMPKVRVLKKENYFLYLGRIEVNQKGIDLLLTAFAQVHKSCSATLIIAGKGEQNQIEVMNKLIKKLHLTDTVTYVGHVTGESKQALLEQAIASIAPSRFETFSLVCLETLSVGVPLITFSIPGLAWMPETVRTVVPAFSTDALANAMLRLTKKNLASSEITKRGKTFAKAFSWEALTDSYKDYLRGILKT